jgi:hypothetical protein
MLMGLGNHPKLICRPWGSLWELGKVNMTCQLLFKTN